VRKWRDGRIISKKRPTGSARSWATMPVIATDDAAKEVRAVDALDAAETYSAC
jgi:hypothetical protein